jgi:hypothetical protein
MTATTPSAALATLQPGFGDAGLLAPAGPSALRNHRLAAPAGQPRLSVVWLVCGVNVPARAPDGGLIASSVMLATRVLRSVTPRPRMP